MASSTSTRRVLSDLNVNAPVVKSVSTPLKTGSGGTLFGEIKMAKGENAVAIGYVAEGKRPVVGMQDGESASKRRKIGGERVDGERGFLSPSPQSSPSASPASSFGNSTTNDLNDSQNTIYTLPDEFLYPTTAPPTSQPQQSSPLSSDQLRAKARAIRLRLSLASYKVRTNQIDVPISRLEIRSSSLPKLPHQLRRTMSNNSITRRTALPSKPSSHFPTYHMQNKRRDFGIEVEEMPSSPPSRANSAPVSPRKLGEGGEFVTTPILPRQRRGLLNPPFLAGGSEMDRERDLTSSVVKGRAADGLLSLMRMAN